MDFNSFVLTHFDVVIAKLQKRNQLVTAWPAEGRSCPQNHTVRNVWRAPCPDPFGPPHSMFKIYCNSYASGHTCPPDHTVRNVWRAPPFGSAAPLGPPLGRPDRQCRPGTPEWVQMRTAWAAKVSHGCFQQLTINPSNGVVPPPTDPPQRYQWQRIRPSE